MKRIIYTTLLSLSFFTINAQTISEADKYLIFIKTWNFLKYYHPAFASGKINADSFFLAKQKLVENINTQPAINQTLINTINEIGLLREDIKTDVSIKNIIKINPLHKWYVDNKIVSDNLKSLLLQVYNNRDVKNHHYLPLLNYNTEIPNEKIYDFAASENLPEPMRLLALAKLQGAIDYLYPHHTLMKEKWDVVMKRNIPLFKKCASRKDYEILILKIVANLNDSHAYNRFYSSLKFRSEIFKNTFYPPFDYKIIDNKILVTKIIYPELCAKAGIELGDWITEINGASIPSRIDTLGKLLGASNKNTLISKINSFPTNFIWSADNATFNLKLLRNNHRKQVSIDFLNVRNKDVAEKINNYLKNKSEVSDSLKGFMLLKNDIAYFNIDKIIQLFKSDDEKRDSEMDSIFNLTVKQKAIIFDMRGYPQWSGFIYTYLYKKFGRPEDRFAKYYKSNLNNVGTFDWNNLPATYHSITVTPEQFKYTGKVMIIVNAQTRSLSEWETMDLQSMFPNAKTIGEQTSGADGDEKYINIPGNYQVHFTGNAIYYPDGTSAQGKGVRIDKIIHPTPSDILTGKDTLLDYAIKEVQ
ncbi:S41 family peptidase [Pedobacter nototheniae]|uniref:S41 family peptidase n=1 Tax=Pedobacter nototheniae TaxID=2488994 RepID=UPI00103AB02F|nr:S41 family peptidase [Pedobacter nototheniae]